MLRGMILFDGAGTGGEPYLVERNIMGFIFYAVIVGVVSLIFVIVGVVSYCSKTPAKMNTGEADIPPEKLRDVTAWNHAHGLLWIGFAIIFAISMLVFPILLEHVNVTISMVILIGMMFLEIGGLSVGHHRLQKKYML